MAEKTETNPLGAGRLPTPEEERNKAFHCSPRKVAVETLEGKHGRFWLKKKVCEFVERLYEKEMLETLGRDINEMLEE